MFRFIYFAVLASSMKTKKSKQKKLPKDTLFTQTPNLINIPKSIEEPQV